MEFAPVGCWKPALVGLEGAVGRKEGLFLGVVPSALRYQHLIPPSPLETLPRPPQSPSGGVWDSMSKQERLSEERAAVGTQMDVPVLPFRPAPHQGFNFLGL